MAKITAPMLSFDARGQIGKTQVYSNWRGQPYARRHVVPSNPRTTAQQTTRTTFATLREMWKLADESIRAPWDAFARGRSFLGLNAFIGENMRVVRGQPDFQNFVASPGAAGGLPIASLEAVAGSSSGEIDVTITYPTLPPGWSVVAGVAMAFPDQDPALDFVGPWSFGDDGGVSGPITLAGLPANTLCVVGAYIEYTKPDGRPAYSIGVTTTANSAV